MGGRIMSEVVNINIPFSKKNHEMLREASFLARRSINKIVNEIVGDNLPAYLKKVKEEKGIKE
jgi:hypothetical protein